MSHDIDSNVCKTCGSVGGVLKKTLRQKLDQRIHNQRSALRDNWQIASQRFYWLKTRPLKDRYLKHIVKQLGVIKALERKFSYVFETLEQIASMSRDQTSFVDIARGAVDEVKKDQIFVLEDGMTDDLAALREHFISRCEELETKGVKYMYVDPKDLHRLLVQ